MAWTIPCQNNRGQSGRVWFSLLPCVFAPPEPFPSPASVLPSLCFSDYLPCLYLLSRVSFFCWVLVFCLLCFCFFFSFLPTGFLLFCLCCNFFISGISFIPVFVVLFFQISFPVCFAIPVFGSGFLFPQRHLPLTEGLSQLADPVG